MSRGGKRAGAGRKYILSPELEFLIREDFARFAWGQRLHQAAQVAERAAGIVWEEDGLPNPVSQVPLKERPAVSKYGSLEPDAKIPDDLSEEARYAIDAMRANKEKLEGKPRHYRGELPRLYRGRQAIINKIARLRGVSARTVRSILEGET